MDIFLKNLIIASMFGALILIGFYPNQSLADQSITYSQKNDDLWGLKSLKYAEDYQKRIKFWEQIFLDHDDQVIVIHDRFRPWIIIDYIYFDIISAQNHQSNPIARSQQNLIIDAYINRYKQALNNFKEHGLKGVNYGYAERKLFLAYQYSTDNLQLLVEGKLRIRTQRGLANSFLIGAKNAQDYLPYFEKEFRSQGVPAELTRLAFVESMFNPNAFSKVGASGMWQFMPATAKIFLKVNNHIDERSSPFKAANAAASYLKSHFEKLQKWPLAVTAYNHGRAGVLRATRVTESNDISVIVKYYNQRSFGFASQNFFAEVMAVIRSYQKLIDQRKLSVIPSSLDIASINLKTEIKVKNLAKKLQTKPELIAKLNPCIKKSTFEHHPDFKLPKRYRLYLPRSTASKYLNN